MKRILSAILAMSLVASPAAMSRGYEGHDRGHVAYYRYGSRDHGGDAVAVGLGILALGLFATLAAPSDHVYYNAPPVTAPPPPPPPYGYGNGAYAYPPPSGDGPNYGFSFQFGR
jgi:hypothetical protein